MEFLKKQKNLGGDLSEYLVNEQNNIFNVESFLQKLIFMNNFNEIDQNHQIPPFCSVLASIDQVTIKISSCLKIKIISNKQKTKIMFIYLVYYAQQYYNMRIFLPI